MTLITQQVSDLLPSKNTSQFVVIIYSYNITYLLFSLLHIHLQKTGINRPHKIYSYIHSTLDRTIEAHQMKYSKDQKSHIADPGLP